MRGKPLIVYYSRTEFAAQVSEYLAALTGSDTVRLIPVNSYPDDYYECVEQGRKEVRSAYCPELRPYDCNLEAYATVHKNQLYQARNII